MDKSSSLPQTSEKVPRQQMEVHIGDRRTIAVTTRHPELLAPRWHKVLGDLWSNKVRTLLVVLSIFIGIFAVGLIAASEAVLSRELQQSYIRRQPAHLTVSIGSTGYNEDFTANSASSQSAGFDDELVDSVRHMREVAEAEGRHIFDVRIRVGINNWKTLRLIGIDDYDDITVNTISPVAGEWPPPRKAVLIERSGLGPGFVHWSNMGEALTIELSDGKQRELRMDGVVHDLHQWPSPFLDTIYGYVSMDTIEWLGEPRDYNRLYVRVAEHPTNQAHIEEIAQEVYDKIQKAGLDPSFPHVSTPGEHPLHFIITALLMVMGVLGVLSIILSGFLIANTIAALLGQQIKQIGMMKAVGARPTQIMTMYIVLVLCFGLIALLPAIPLAQVAAHAFTHEIAHFLNFTLDSPTIPHSVVILQALVSLTVPLVAALIPVYMGTRITIREALSEGGTTHYGTSIIDTLMQRVRGLPRPILLALRNSFRRKTRLALTLITLTLGGAMFISVFSVRDSLLSTFHDYLNRLYHYDVELFLDRTYRADYLISEVERVPGVVAAESLVQTSVRRVLTGDEEGQTIHLFAIPADTHTIQPQIIEGRWLLPEDDNALVISTGMLKDDPDLQIGSEIVLKIKEHEETWFVVGIMPTIGESRWVYANYDYYGRVAGEVEEASYLRIITEQHTPEFQTQVEVATEKHLKSIGINISSTKTISELSQGDMSVIEVITICLLFMAVLVALVGGLGLAGMMSLNVIERTREIGIMRSIGASDHIVLLIFMVEGIVIGIISWFCALLISPLLSKLLSDSMGIMLLSMPLEFHFSLVGVLIWLLISCILSAVASFLPSWNAVQLTVRDVLAYE